MIKKETRDIFITYCDYCGDETTHTERCEICGREMCDVNKHSAYFIEIYRYGDHERLRAHICTECSASEGVDILFDAIKNNAKMKIIIVKKPENELDSPVEPGIDRVKM